MKESDNFSEELQKLSDEIWANTDKTQPYMILITEKGAKALKDAGITVLPVETGIKGDDEDIAESKEPYKPRISRR